MRDSSRAGLLRAGEGQPSDTRRVAAAARSWVLLLVLLALCAEARGQAARKDATLDIATQGDRYTLTVPVSRLTMTLPRAGLERKQAPEGGATESPRYFLLENPTLHLVVSGWFEPAKDLSIKKFWAGEVAAWKKQNKPEPLDVTFEKIGSWDAILYEVAVSPGGSSHIRAEWIQAGTWIDLHISITSEASAEDRHRELRAFLGAIQISEKAP